MAAPVLRSDACHACFSKCYQADWLRCLTTSDHGLGLRQACLPKNSVSTIYSRCSFQYLSMCQLLTLSSMPWHSLLVSRSATLIALSQLQLQYSTFNFSSFALGFPQAIPTDSIRRNVHYDVHQPTNQFRVASYLRVFSTALPSDPSLVGSRLFGASPFDSELSIQNQSTRSRSMCFFKLTFQHP